MIYIYIYIIIHFNEHYEHLYLWATLNNVQVGYLIHSRYVARSKMSGLISFGYIPKKKITELIYSDIYLEKITGLYFAFFEELSC